MVTKIKWHDFKKEGPPSDSRQVFITDGKQLGTAHYFSKVFVPPNYKAQIENNKFENQHNRILGNYINTENVIYWADVKVDVELPKKKTKS
jgi:hypothetical protein